MIEVFDEKVYKALIVLISTIVFLIVDITFIKVYQFFKEGKFKKKQ